MSKEEEKAASEGGAAGGMASRPLFWCQLSLVASFTVAQLEGSDEGTWVLGVAPPEVVRAGQMICREVSPVSQSEMGVLNGYREM